MQIYLLFLIIVFADGKKSHKEKEPCVGVHVRGKIHKQEVLSNGVNRPYQLSCHNHTVFFSYNIGEDRKDTFQIGYVRPGEKEPIPINETINGFATAVDGEKQLIYFGGSDGIYEHHFHKPGEMKHIVKGVDIWDMFFKKHLFFIVYPSLRLHKKVENGTELAEHIPEKILQFAIDGNDDVFFTTKEGLFEVKNGTKERIAYEGPKVFRAIEVDRKGVVHFCGQNAIYVADKEKHKLEEIAHIKNIFGLTFDHNNDIIYSNSHEIIRLVEADCK